MVWGIIFYIRQMSSMIKLNESDSVNYLIHGQDLTLDFNFATAFFVCIHYNPVPATSKFRKGSFWWFQRLHWFSRKGVFQSKVNVFYPQLTLYVIGWGIKKISIPLQVDRVHVVKNVPTVHLPDFTYRLPSMPVLRMAEFNSIHPLFLTKFSQSKTIKPMPSIQLPWTELEQRLIDKNK